MLHRANPNVVVMGRLHRKKLMEGCGMGSVILNKGGAGAGSSYTDLDAYMNITGNSPARGSGLGEKLNKLIVKPLNKKPQNIKFELN
jgi:hypothetical protein